MNNPEDQGKPLPQPAKTDESKEHASTYKKQKSRPDTFMEDLTAGIDKNLNRLRNPAEELREQGES